MSSRSTTVRWLAPKHLLRSALGVALLFLAACNMATPAVEAPLDDTPTLSVLAIGGTVTGDKSVADDVLLCGEGTTVTLTLDGQVSIAENPVDVMLVLDRSGSMGGTPLANLKIAANAFVDLIEDTNDGLPPGITVFSRVGVVSFAATASLNQALTTDLDAVRAAINGLAASGTTAIGDGINLAQAQLGGSEPLRPKVMIVVTDGVNNAGANPVTAANAAKGAGTEIFVIGFGGINLAQLQAIASLPLADHLFVSPDPDGSELEAAFAALGAAIVQPAGTDITVVDTVHPNFVVSNAVASHGAVALVGNVLTWTIDELGTETATLSYDIDHVDTLPGGTLEVNTSVVYADAEGKSVTFPSPTVEVHGCAAELTLTPEAEDNIVGEDHTVTATVTDDFGDPVAGITVEFSVVGGPSIVDGDPSDPTPDSGMGVTDANGQTTFTYTNPEASPDTITATAPFGQANVSVDLVDTAEKTWLPIEVAIDVQPQSCPNPFNVGRRGTLPVAIVGTADLDVTTIDISTVLLEGVAPTRWSFEDVATPYEPYTGKTERLDCTTAGADGTLDLVLHFDGPSVAAAIAPVADGDVVALLLTGEVVIGGVGYDFVGEDVVWIRQ